MLLNDPEITRTMTFKDAKEEHDLPYGNISILPNLPDLTPAPTHLQVQGSSQERINNDAVGAGNSNNAIVVEGETLTSRPQPIDETSVATVPNPKERPVATVSTSSELQATTATVPTPTETSVETVPSPSVTQMITTSAPIIKLDSPFFSNLLGGLVTEATITELQGQLTRSITKGKNMKERLSKLKKLTSGNLVQSGSFCLCHDVCEHQIQQNKEKNENEDRGKK